MTTNNLFNVPTKSSLFCLVNYSVCASVLNGDERIYFDLAPINEPIIARSLEEAKTILAKKLNVDVNLLSEWDLVGEEDEFSPSICIGYNAGAFGAGYSFDVYKTINTYHLV